MTILVVPNSVSGGYSTNAMLTKRTSWVYYDAATNYFPYSKDSITINSTTYYDSLYELDYTLSNKKPIIKACWTADAVNYKSTITGLRYHQIFTENDSNLLKEGNINYLNGKYIGYTGTYCGYSIFDGNPMVNSNTYASSNLGDYVVPCCYGRVYGCNSNFSLQLEYLGIKTDVKSYSCTTPTTVCTPFFPVAADGESLTLYVTNNSTDPYYICIAQDESSSVLKDGRYFVNETLAAGATGTYTWTPISEYSTHYYRISISPYRNLGFANISFKDDTISPNIQNYSTEGDVVAVYYNYNNNIQESNLSCWLNTTDDTLHVHNYSQSYVWNAFISNEHPYVAFDVEVRNESDSHWSTAASSLGLNKPFTTGTSVSWLTTGTRIITTGMRSGNAYCIGGLGFSGTNPTFDGFDFSNGNTTYTTTKHGAVPIMAVCYRFYRLDNNGTVKIYNTEIPYNSDNRLYNIPVRPNTPFLVTPPAATTTYNAYIIKLCINDSTKARELIAAPQVEQTLTMKNFKKADSNVNLSITGTTVPKCYIRVSGEWKKGMAYIYNDDISGWNAIFPFAWKNSKWNACNATT